ncbi:hypothetical protein BDF14DRAFT_1858528 [Spinellus fusiger]|nr:hypothetical protein BDF14DRAFT_1858528 [Spinellus fusiger]
MNSNTETTLPTETEVQAEVQNEVYSTEEERRCWICFGEDSDSEGRWIRPCPCSLIAHEKCLLEWIIEMQKEKPMKEVRCPQCAAAYIFTQTTSLTLSVLSTTYQVIRVSAPYILGLIIGCSVMVAATTYGAYTVVTVMGVKESDRWIGNPSQWTWRAWVGLPSIPISLMASVTSWGDGVPFVAFLFMCLSRRSYARPRFAWPPSPLTVMSVFPMAR